MRPIRFRVWHKADGMIYYGDQPLHITLDGNLWNADDKNDPLPIKLLDCGYTLMQFTGLHDMHGKEIWEGDVVRHFPLIEDDDDIADETRWVVDEVIFLDATFRFQRCRQWKDGEHNWYSLENLDAQYIEVLGNLYEHPELIR